MARITYQKGDAIDTALTFGAIIPTAICFYLGFNMWNHVPKVYSDGSTEGSLKGPAVVLFVFAGIFLIATISGIVDYIKFINKKYE